MRASPYLKGLVSYLYEVVVYNADGQHVMTPWQGNCPETAKERHAWALYHYKYHYGPTVGVYLLRDGIEL